MINMFTVTLVDINFRVTVLFLRLFELAKPKENSFALIFEIYWGIKSKLRFFYKSNRSSHSKLRVNLVKLKKMSIKNF